MHHAFRYVGPPEIALGAESAAGGIALRSQADVVDAARALGLRVPGVVTYVVDAVGTLLAASLARAGIPGPTAFEPAFEMRRCVRCGARQS